MLPAKVGFASLIISLCYGLNSVFIDVFYNLKFATELNKLANYFEMSIGLLRLDHKVAVPKVNNPFPARSNTITIGSLRYFYQSTELYSRK